MIRTSQMSDEQFALFIQSHPISGGKRDDNAKNTEKSEANFTNTLQSTFATNNAKQQQQLDFLNGRLKEAVDNPQGYSPQTLASMRTQATDAAAQNNAKVMQAVKENNALNGGASATALPSGVEAQIESGVAEKEAENEANAQLGITQQNGQLQNENQWRAIQDEEGVAGLENPEGAANASTGSAGTVSNLSQAVTSANGPGIGSILGGVVGAGVGAVGSYFGSKKG